MDMTPTVYTIREHVFNGIIATDNIIKSCTLSLYNLLKVFLPYTHKLDVSQSLASSQKLNCDGKMGVKLACQTTTERLSAVVPILESSWKVPRSCFFLCFDQVYDS